MAFSSSTAVRPNTTAAPPQQLPKPYRPSSAAALFFQKPTKFNQFSSSKAASISCVLTKEAMVTKEDLEPVVLQRPDSFGRFGKFGGKYVPETLMYALSELEDAFKSLSTDREFQVS